MRPKIIDSHLGEIDAILGDLGRYKAVVVTHESPLMLAQLAKECSIYLQGKHIPVLEALGPQLTDNKGYYALGICEFPDLIKWILEQSYKSPDACLIINELEPLVATFGRGNATEFFQALAIVEPKLPVVCFTYLNRQIIEAKFPTGRHLIL